MALGAVISGAAQNSQPAPTTSTPAASGQAAPAAPEAKKKNYKDQQEFTLYDSATKETDANKKLATLNTWKDKYPETDFKQERLTLYLNTYQSLGQAAKMVDTAKEILAIDPKDITALYWITFLAPSSGNTSADALDTDTKAANGLLAAEKPAATKDEDWKIAKANFDAIAYKTLGWVAFSQHNNADAETNYKKSLAVDPKSGEVTYSLAQVLLADSIAQKKPELQSQALYYFARAAALDGQGALNPDGRKKVDDYLTKIYTTLHGDTNGLAELKATAKANPIAPADFKIKTAAEIASEKEEDLKKTNPELALWLNVKGQLLSPDGQTYFDSSMKGAAVPKLKGWLVSAKPPVKSKELLISMEGKDGTPNVTLKLVGSDGTTPAPLTGKPEVGVEVQFEGIGDSFTKEPLMVTFGVEKGKICTVTPDGCTTLKEEKVAPARRPVHKKQ
jgi:tetratricopeptide (TPR) repeat protein